MRQLKLGGLAKNWQRVKYKNPEQYVLDLLEIEVREREVNRINRLVKLAGFHVIKTLENFQWHKDIAIPGGITREKLEQFSFIENKENLIMMGAVGGGKTHLATAIALRACQNCIPCQYSP